MDNSRILGLLGGMSWVSTEHYYRGLNEGVSAARGRQHSAELLLASVDFQPIVDLQVKGDWSATGAILAERARGLERGGAGAFLIASNTMHLVYEQVREAVSIPGLDIFDASAAAVTARGLREVGLLGTRYTMSHAFYRDQYEKRGVKIRVPQGEDARRVNEIIFRELIHGVVKESSRDFYRGVVERLGGDGVILGCTEIGILLKDGDIKGLPVIDTTKAHVAAGLSWLLAERRT